jgi:hypothetical protein
MESAKKSLLVPFLRLFAKLQMAILRRDSRMSLQQLLRAPAEVVRTNTRLESDL